MSRVLPDQPSLERLKNEAKSIKKSHSKGDPSACATLRLLAEFRAADDAQILAAEVPLQKVQHALAREYGFDSWKAISDQITGGEVFEERYRRAYKIFCAKGPAEDSTGSEYEQEIDAERKALLAADGDLGFKVFKRLAREENGRARNAAVIGLGLSKDPRAEATLSKLLSDESVAVRSRAVRFYASKIQPCPQCEGDDFAVPGGLSEIIPLVSDANTKVQLDAIHALGVYLPAGDPGVEEALRKALGDPLHKVCHAAAQALQVDCPACGKTPCPYPET